jgi:hypothetical protein
MLDPLTALSLAASIVQLVDFSNKVLSDSYEVYKAGSTSEHEDIKSITTDLSALVDRIQHDLEPVSGPNGPLSTNEQVSHFVLDIEHQCFCSQSDFDELLYLQCSRDCTGSQIFCHAHRWWIGPANQMLLI